MEPANWDLNPRPTHYKCVALPTELHRLRLLDFTIIKSIWTISKLKNYKNFLKRKITIETIKQIA